GAVIDRECERYFARFSAGELDPRDVRASLTVLGSRFLELLLSPDGIDLYRIILGEVTRFPRLGEVFWRAGPERQRIQIEAFLKSAVATGTLALADTRGLKPDPRHRNPLPRNHSIKVCGSLATLASRTIRPVASTTHKLALSNDSRYRHSIPWSSPMMLGAGPA